MVDRHTLVLVLGLAALAGCKRENPGFLGPGGGSTAATDSGVASSGSAGDTGGTTASASTGLSCELPKTGRKIEVEFGLTGGGTLPCPVPGVPIERWVAPTQTNGSDQVQLAVCDVQMSPDGCDLCNQVGTLRISGPPGAVPAADALPDCFKVSIYSDTLPMMNPTCEISSVALRRRDTNEAVYPFYVASIGTHLPPEELKIYAQPLQVTKTPLETCPCPECCASEASTYALTFDYAGLPEPIVLEPGDSDETPPIADKVFRVSNVEAHDAVACDARPEIYWSFGEVEFLDG